MQGDAVSIFSNPLPPPSGFAVIGAEEDESLPAAELDLLSPRAAPKRRRDFILGRQAAHQALRHLGPWDCPAIGRDAGGRPLWPAGIVGSISHSGVWAVAAVSESTQSAALGVDLERIRAIDPKVWRHVLTAAEKQWIGGRPDRDKAFMAAFSIKESVFKAWSAFSSQPLALPEIESGLAQEVDIDQEGVITLKAWIERIPGADRRMHFASTLQFNNNMVLSTARLCWTEAAYFRK